MEAGYYEEEEQESEDGVKEVDENRRPVNF